MRVFRAPGSGARLGTASCPEIPPVPRNARVKSSLSMKMAAFLRSKCSSAGRTLMGYFGNNFCGATNSSVEAATIPSHCDAISQDDTSQLMCKVWDWNMYGAKLKKFDGCVLHTANEDGERGEDDATALPGDCAEDGGSGLENHDSGMASKDSNDEPRQHEWLGQRAVQLLAICANFPICEIYCFDWHQGRCIYVQREGEVQEEGMVDLVPIGPRRILMAYGYLSLEVYADSESGPPIITEDWDVSVDDEIEEYTRTICAGPGRKFEMTYLVIPNAIEANVEVKLKLKDLGCRSRAVYGKIKASTTDYRNKSVHLLSCGRGTSLSFPCGSTSILPLSPSVVAVPCRWQLELHIEVDLTVITTFDSEEEQDKKLRFSLEFTHEITSQKREVDDDQVEVKIEWCSICW